MNWKIGQKVVCIQPTDCRTSFQIVVGEIYTVSVVENLPAPIGGRFDYLGLKEAEPTNRYWIGRFRPIVDIGDEVEEYIKSKITEPEYA